MVLTANGVNNVNDALFSAQVFGPGNVDLLDVVGPDDGDFDQADSFQLLVSQGNQSRGVAIEYVPPPTGADPLGTTNPTTIQGVARTRTSANPNPTLGNCTFAATVITGTTAAPTG